MCTVFTSELYSEIVERGVCEVNIQMGEGLCVSCFKSGVWFYKAIASDVVVMRVFGPLANRSPLQET